jgi:hypothetical protein
MLGEEECNITADTSNWVLSDVRGVGVSCIITADTSNWVLSDVRGGGV